MPGHDGRAAYGAPRIQRESRASLGGAWHPDPQHRAHEIICQGIRGHVVALGAWRPIT